MIVAFEGIDGAGKTTCAKLLVDRIEARGHRVVFCSKNTMAPTNEVARGQMNRLRDTLWPPPSTEPTADPQGTHFYLYLLAAWWTALHSHCIGPANDRDTIVVLDNWHTRNIVKAVQRANLPVSWVESLFSHLEIAASVVLLDIEPQLAWRRRESFKPAELGRWDGADGSPETMFCSYQQKIREGLLRMAVSRKFMIVKQLPAMTASDVVAAVIRELDLCK